MSEREGATVVDDRVLEVRIGGTVKWGVSERDDCVCCDGPHVYMARVELAPGVVSEYDHLNDVSTFVSRAARQMGNGTEVEIIVRRRTPTSEGGPDVAQDVDQMHGSEGGERESCDHRWGLVPLPVCIRCRSVKVTVSTEIGTILTGGTDGE